MDKSMEKITAGSIQNDIAGIRNYAGKEIEGDLHLHFHKSGLDVDYDFSGCTFNNSILIQFQYSVKVKFNFDNAIFHGGVEIMLPELSQI